MSNRDDLFGTSNDNTSWENAYDSTDENGGVKDKAQSMLDDANVKKDEAVDKAKGMMDDGKHKADEMAHKAQDKADEGLDKAADSMDRGAQMLREKGHEQGGKVGEVADTAADAMQSASGYLRETNTAEMMDQVEAYIRQNPTQSLLIAAGVGFVLARAFK